MKYVLNSKLSNVTESLGAVLDKALCEDEFRWRLISEPEEVLREYEVTEPSDIEIVDNLIKDLKTFIDSRGRVIINQSSKKNFKKSNPNLSYSDAIEYKKSHN